MLAKFQENQRSTVMSSIKCLNFKFFCSIKLCTKNKYIIQFEQNLTYMSKTYGTYNSIIRFLKFTSNKKNEKSLMGLEILERNLICYLLFGPVLVPLLVNWDPFETSFKASKAAFGSCKSISGK